MNEPTIPLPPGWTHDREKDSGPELWAIHGPAGALLGHVALDHGHFTLTAVDPRRGRLVVLNGFLDPDPGTPELRAFPDHPTRFLWVSMAIAVLHQRLARAGAVAEARRLVGIQLVKGD